LSNRPNKDKYRRIDVQKQGHVSCSTARLVESAQVVGPVQPPASVLGAANVAKERSLRHGQKSWLERATRSDLCIIGLGVIAVVLKALISLNTLGTNDVESFYMFGHALSEHGLQWTYTHYRSFNHPPLVGYFLQSIYAVSQVPLFQRNGFTFPFFLRLPSILCDFGVLLLLLRNRREFSLSTLSLTVLALCPVTLMISGFHGNTDSVMVMLLVLAAYSCFRENPIACGLLLALSCQIKIIPLLVLPIFACFWYARRATLRFVIPFTAAYLLCLLPVVAFPFIFFKHVLAYGSIWGLWGISFWLRLTGVHDFCLVGYHDLPFAENLVGTALKASIVGCVIALSWRRRHLSGCELLRTIAYAWIAFFILAPGSAPQYLAWPIPFLIILSPAKFISFTLSSSVFLFFLYNTLAGKLPWYLAVASPESADRIAPWALWPWGVLIGIAAFSWKSMITSTSDRHLLSPSIPLTPA
jgi:hypothetical protein